MINALDPQDLFDTFTSKALKNPQLVTDFMMYSNWIMTPEGLDAVHLELNYDDIPEQVVQQAKNHGKDFFPSIFSIRHMICHSGYVASFISKIYKIPDLLEDPAHELLLYVLHHGAHIATIYNSYTHQKILTSQSAAEMMIKDMRTSLQPLKVSPSSLIEIRNLNPDSDSHHKHVFLVHRIEENEPRLRWQPSWILNKTENDIFVSPDKLSAFASFINQDLFDSKPDID